MIIYRATSDTFLKKEPKQASETASTLKRAGEFIPVQRILQQTDNHLQVALGYGAGTWWIYLPHWSKQDSDDDQPERVTIEQLRAIMPSALTADLNTYHDPINQTLNDFEITTGLRMAAFLAQVAHESGSLRYKEEIVDGSAYEGRRDLGNTVAGDGKRYKGRGLIQLTGRANYQSAGKALGIDLENDPELAVKNPYINAKIAGWYWDSRDLNPLADRGDFETITRRINGGLNGYSDRLKYYGLALEAFEIVTSVPSRWDSIDWNNPRAKVSRWFTVGEVTLGDRRRIPQSDTIKQNIFALAKELDKVRDGWGKPIIVTSWYRPPAINATVGGAKSSQHLNGSAVDIRPATGSGIEFEAWLDRFWGDRALGYGQRAGKGFTHIDMRSGRIRWNY